MKKRFASLSLILMTLLTTQSLFGQENEINTTKVGLGVSLFNLTDYAYTYDDEPSNSIYLTLDIGSKLRLEPTVGFDFSDGVEQYSIGIGGFERKSISKFNLLYGLRLGINSNDIKMVAPTIGGEYYFIKNFSIGSEVQLRGLQKERYWAVFTYSSVMIRFYF